MQPAARYLGRVGLINTATRPNQFLPDRHTGQSSTHIDIYQTMY